MNVEKHRFPFDCGPPECRLAHVMIASSAVGISQRTCLCALSCVLHSNTCGMGMGGVISMKHMIEAGGR